MFDKPVNEMFECELVYHLSTIRGYPSVDYINLNNTYDAYELLKADLEICEELFKRFKKYLSQYSREKQDNLILEYYLLVKN